MPPEQHAAQGAAGLTSCHGLTGVSSDLQEISRGIHPAILSKGGLGPALKTLARRSAVPVDLDLAYRPTVARLVEVGAYYVVSEALTNAAKHARASVVKVGVETEGAKLQLSIRDDGIGGADSARVRPHRPDRPGGGTRRDPDRHQPTRPGHVPTGRAAAQRLASRSAAGTPIPNSCTTNASRAASAYDDSESRVCV